MRERTQGRGPDSVIDAVGMEAHGSPIGKLAHRLAGFLPDAVAQKMVQTAGIDRLAALHTAIELVRRGGTISLSGVYGGAVSPMPMIQLFDKQVNMRMGQANVRRWIDDLMPHVTADDDPLGVEGYATHRVPLERGAARVRDLPEEAGRGVQGPAAAMSPEGPTDMKARSWGGVLKRTVTEFKNDNLSDWAAALTYYAILAIFPALLALISILGLVGQSATQPLIDNVSTVAPGAAKDIATDAIRNLQQGQGAAGVLFVVGLATAIWSASGYIAAFMRASNAIYDIGEGRPIWKTLPVRVGLTFVLLVLTAVSAIAVVVSGGLAQKVGDTIGVGSTAVDVWNIAKWPVLVLLVSFMFALLYWAAPNVKQPGFRWVSPGGILAVLLWIAASLAFAFYVANFASYNKTYGALGGVIIFLVWLWISNIAVLLGAEFNAELERGRRLEAGQHAQDDPYVEPRDTRKLDDDEKRSLSPKQRS